MRRFDFAHQLVRLLLRHLPATNHVLQEITGALENETGKAGSGADHVLHCGGHFASRLQTDLMRLRCHLGDRIFYIGAAMTGTAFWRNRWRAGCAD